MRTCTLALLTCTALSPHVYDIWVKTAQILSNVSMGAQSLDDIRTTQTRNFILTRASESE